MRQSVLQSVRNSVEGQEYVLWDRSYATGRIRVEELFLRKGSVHVRMRIRDWLFHARAGRRNKRHGVWLSWIAWVQAGVDFLKELRDAA